MWWDRDRPSYLPPIRLGEQEWSKTPRGVYHRLLIGPPASLAAVIFVVVTNVATWVVILFIVVLIIESVQAYVYVPRARRAMAEEEEFVAQSDEESSQRLGL